MASVPARAKAHPLPTEPPPRRYFRVRLPTSMLPTVFLVGLLPALSSAWLSGHQCKSAALALQTPSPALS
jgi:hypothetical protein